MEHIEIILKNIEKAQIGKVFCNDVLFDEKDIMSSHFFDKEKNIDVSYQNVGSLKEYFYVPGTCNIYLKKAIIGIELENILILIACDKSYGDITINFEEEQFENYNNQEIKKRLKKLLDSLLKIHKNVESSGIILGYEPADDVDMKILEISQSRMEIFNENILKAPLARMIYSIAKDIYL